MDTVPDRCLRLSSFARRIAAAFPALMLPPLDAHASGGPAFMGLALAAGGLIAFFGLIGLIAGIANLSLPKEKRPAAYFAQYRSILRVAVIVSLFDFLAFNSPHAGAGRPLLLHEEFLVNFLQGLVFGRILFEIILATAVAAIVRALRKRRNA